MRKPGLIRVTGVIAACAVVGAVAGIAGSAAAPSSSSKANAKAKSHVRHGFRRGPMGRAGMGLGGPPVHADLVVPNQNGDGFDKVTMDSGKLKAIDGSSLTVTEGTDKANYREPTIDVGASPKVVRNHQAAALGDLKVGDFVHIVQGPQGTFVMAEDAAFRANEPKDRGPWHHGHGPPDGPPPAGTTG
jgi:hypothetical protein